MLAPPTVSAGSNWAWPRNERNNTIGGNAATAGGNWEARWRLDVCAVNFDVAGSIL
jgi:hypothetical protein